MCESIMVTFVLLIFSTTGLHAWSGILLDGSGVGGTQLYIPSTPAVNKPNVKFGLPHYLAPAAVMLNGKAYFIGGRTGDTGLNSVTVFDPSTNKSKSAARLIEGRSNHAATVVNNTIIVCGGSVNLSSCEQYTPATNKWHMIASLPLSAFEVALVTLNNQVYSFGGDCLSPEPRPVYMFDGHNWLNKTSLPGGSICDHAALALDTNRALICGGLAFVDNWSQYVPDCQIYSASTDSWEGMAPMAEVRSGHSMVMFEGGYL